MSIELAKRRLGQYREVEEVPATATKLPGIELLGQFFVNLLISLR